MRGVTAEGKRSSSLKNKVAEHRKAGEESQKSHAELKQQADEYAAELAKINGDKLASKESYRALVEASPTAIFAVRNQQVMFVNPAGAKLLGYPHPQELAGMRAMDLLVPEYRELVAKRMRRSEEGKINPKVEIEVFRADGSRLVVETTSVGIMLSDGPAVLIMGQDITECKRAQKSLHLSTGILTEVQRIAHLGSWDWNIVTNELSWSDEVYRIFGFQPQEFGATYESFLEHVHPDDRDVVKAAVNKSLAGPDPIYSIEHRVVRLDGTERFVHEKGNVTFDESGRPIRMIGTVYDITDCKNAEQKLQSAFDEISKLKDQLKKENIYLKSQVKASRDLDQIIGESPAIKKTLFHVQQVAGMDSSVLLLGETGTGKELIAHAVHDMSFRKERTLVTVNCSALPSTLVESELFGREKGAFTGALTQQIGRFEIADGSSIFLDEIGELPMETQVKLLRVLEEGQLERLGSSKTINVDVRIIAATNRDLLKSIEEGSFREDLYYRLNVFPIRIPSLRERAEDIPLLVWHFVKEFCNKMGKKIDAIPGKTMEALQNYSWPGNVRELRNILERGMILTRGKTLYLDLPTLPKMKKAAHQPASNLVDLERKHIVDVLARTGWKVSGKGGAADILGLKESTLRARMHKLGINRR
jgi:PAS domain S-box-containing protein